MRLKDSILLALLGFGSPLLVIGSMARTEVCQFDPVKSAVVNISSRIPSAPLLLLAGVAQAAGCYWLVKSERDKERQEAENPQLKAVPAPVAALPDRAAQPLHFGDARLQPVPVEARRDSAPTAATVRIDRTAGIPQQFRWYKDLVGNVPLVLLWGGQGAGKTSLAAYTVRCKVKAGYEVEIWDPHAGATDWQGLNVVGRGMDYHDIDRAMQRFADEVKRLYQERSTNPDFKPVKKLIVCEELSNWADRCSNAGEFFKCALSDIRKIGYNVLLISHGRTLSMLGGSKGTAQTRDNGILELQLLTTLDAEGNPRPAGKGVLKRPGENQIEVPIAEWMQSSMDFTDLVNRPAKAPIAPAEPADPINLRAQLEGLYTASPNFGIVSEPDADENSVSEPEPALEEASAVRIDADTVLKYFPDTPEYDVFAQILKGYEIRLSPSDIVKKQLKMTQPDRYPVGKAISCYLVRKYGNVELFVHFKKWLEA